MKTKEEIANSIEQIFKNTERIHGNSDAIDWIKVASSRSAEYLLHAQFKEPVTDSPALPSDKAIEKYYPTNIKGKYNANNILKQEGAKAMRDGKIK